MAETPTPEAKRREAAERFLEQDFDQCFAEKRRYEDSAWDVTKFTFTAYSAILGVALGSHQVSSARDIDLTPVAVGLLGLGIVIGVFSLLLVVRTRVYFVIVTRYINEHRGFFLQEHPLGFKNESGMFTDRGEPPYFSWSSTQSWAAFLMATLNAVLVAALAFIATAPQGPSVRNAAIAGTVFELGQVLVAAIYLRSRENRTASQAAFGNRRG